MLNKGRGDKMKILLIILLIYLIIGVLIFMGNYGIIMKCLENFGIIESIALLIRIILIIPIEVGYFIIKEIIKRYKNKEGE